MMKNTFGILGYSLKMKTNRQLIEFYKNKHELEHVFFSEKTDNDNFKLIDGTVTPLKLDLRQYCSPTDNQGKTSHCAAFTVANILESLYWKNSGKLLQFDAAQIYAKSKEVDGFVDLDGTYPEIAMSVGLELSKSLLTQKYKVKKIYNDENIVSNLKRIIHKNGLIAGGFKITEDWMYLKKGNSFLDSYSKKELGGHCVTIVGYFNDSLIVQNSWGREWGASGFARISWKVVEKEFIYGTYLEKKDEF